MFINCRIRTIIVVFLSQKHLFFSHLINIYFYLLLCDKIWIVTPMAIQNNKIRIHQLDTKTNAEIPIDIQSRETE